MQRSEDTQRDESPEPHCTSQSTPACFRMGDTPSCCLSLALNRIGSFFLLCSALRSLLCEHLEGHQWHLGVGPVSFLQLRGHLLPIAAAAVPSVAADRCCCCCSLPSPPPPPSPPFLTLCRRGRRWTWPRLQTTGRTTRTARSWASEPAAANSSRRGVTTRAKGRRPSTQGTCGSPRGRRAAVMMQWCSVPREERRGGEDPLSRSLSSVCFKSWTRQRRHHKEAPWLPAMRSGE